MEQKSTRKVWQDKAYQMEIPELLRAVESPVETGLSSADVAKRQAEYGSNALEVEKHSYLLEKFIEQFKDFMIIILLAVVDTFNGFLGKTINVHRSTSFIFLKIAPLYTRC